MQERDRFDKFTERARKVLSLAQEEAQRLQHNYIGAEHLLLGLVREEHGAAARALANLGLDILEVRQTVTSVIGKGDHLPLGEITLTINAKKAIERAFEEAQNLNHSFVDTEDLLLGLLYDPVDEKVKELYKVLDLTLEKVRTIVIQVASTTKIEDFMEYRRRTRRSIPPLPPQAASLLTRGQLALVCIRCGALSPSYFNYCFHCGEKLHD